MNYSKLVIFRTIKEYYQTETDYISPYNPDIKFFHKTKYPAEFLALNFIENSDNEFIIYLFKSEHFVNKDKFETDFELGDISFRIDDINILNTILIANNL